MDNAPSHPPIDVLNNINTNFEMQYLPPNVTAIIQPMDQGVISITKKLYKKQLLSKLVLKDNQLNISEFLRNFTLRDCITLISSVWQNIQSSTLRKVWKPMLGNLISINTHESSATIENNNESIEESIEVSSCISQQLKNNNIDVSEIKQWINTEEQDKDLEYLNDTEIIETVINCNKEFVNIGHINESLSEETNYQPLKKISHIEAYKSLQISQQWCEQQSECDIADVLCINKLLGIAAAKSMREDLDEHV